MDIERAVEIVPGEPVRFSLWISSSSRWSDHQHGIVQQPEGEVWTQREVLLWSTELLLTSKAK